MNKFRVAAEQHVGHFPSVEFCRSRVDGRGEEVVLKTVGEGGKIRFLKNIMGLWIIQSIKRELNDEYSFNDLEKMARECSDFDSVVDVNDLRFLAPKSMIEAIKSYCKDYGMKVPESIGEVMQCAYISLAKCYDISVKSLEKIEGRTYDSIKIVGGGSCRG